MPLQHIAADMLRTHGRAGMTARDTRALVQPHQGRDSGGGVPDQLHRRLPRRDRCACRRAVPIPRRGAVRPRGGVRLRARARDAVACDDAAGAAVAERRQRRARLLALAAAPVARAAGAADRRAADGHDRRPGRPGARAAGHGASRAHRRLGVGGGRRRGRWRRGSATGLAGVACASPAPGPTTCSRGRETANRGLRFAS